jgi:hypothetical protein
MKKVPPRTTASDPSPPPPLPEQDAPPVPLDRLPSPRSGEGEQGEQRGHRRGPSATSGAPALPERKTSPREGGAAKLKDAIATSKSAGALSSQPAVSGVDNAAARKSAFGQRMASHPQKKQSLANIFFMSSPLVRRERMAAPVVD